MSQAAISDILTNAQKDDLSKVCYINKEAFCTTEKPIGNVTGQDIKLELNCESPYPPALRKASYPSSPKSRIPLGQHIKELIDLRVLRKVGHDEQVEITTPVVVPGIMINPEWLEILEL